MSDSSPSRPLKTDKKEQQQKPEPRAEQEQDPQEEIRRMREQMLRLQADFENARKRWLKEQAELQERANADVLGRLLDIFDDFQRAVAVGATDKGGSVFLAGVEMIARRMNDFLKSYGIAPIESVGKPFDPEFQEAVAHEVNDSLPESTVLAELRRGYLMNGKVLRPSVVKVSVREKGGSSDGKGNRD